MLEFMVHFSKKLLNVASKITLSFIFLILIFMNNIVIGLSKQSKANYHESDYPLID